MDIPGCQLPTHSLPTWVKIRNQMDLLNDLRGSNKSREGEGYLLANPSHRAALLPLDTSRQTSIRHTL